MWQAPDYTKFDAFESIGRNCEFGAIQRAIFKAEPLGLLRWAGSASRSLLTEAFRRRFAGLGDSMTGHGVPPGEPPDRQHFWLTDTRYDIVFHTPCKVANHTVEQARLVTAPRLKRLSEMLLEHIERAERLLLYSDKTLVRVEDVFDLQDAVSAIGPAWMVAVMEHRHRAGTARLVRDGLIEGYVDKLTELGQANTFRPDMWPDMLTQALAIYRTARVDPLAQVKG